MNEGDRVPADAVILSCVNLSVNESLLTGESVSVRKVSGSSHQDMGRPCGDDLPFVYSGTLVVQGQGIAQVKATGLLTEIGKIGKELQRLEPEQTLLQKETGRLVRKLALLGLTLCVVVVVVFGLTRGNWLNGLLAGLTLAMATMPEEFPVVLTVFLAIGAWRISQKRVLTRRVPAIETLGSTTLKKFPDWLKTKYYCENIDIFHCKNGKKVSGEEMRLWILEQGRESEAMAFLTSTSEDLNYSSISISRENVDSSLQRYEINKKANGQIIWMAYSGASSLRTGVCTILEDILFLGPWQDERTDLTKRQFFARLSLLPECNQTKYYCHRLSLHECKSVNLVAEEMRWWRRKSASTQKQDKGNGYKKGTGVKISKGT